MYGIILILFLFYLPKVAEAYEDKVWLQDGSCIQGEIVATKPNISFTIKKADDTIHVFKMEDIWKINFEEKGIYTDKLYLKDGSVITGEIIGSIPHETYRMKAADGSILVFRMDEVNIVEFGEKLPKPPVTPPSPKIEPQPQVPFMPSPAQEERLKIAVSLNYPGAGIKIKSSPYFLFEARLQFAKNIYVYGGRVQYYFNPKAKIHYFAGIEGDFISFKGEVSKGTGYAIVGFLGAEYFLSDRFSLQLDFGPSYINIKDKGSNLSESGVDYLVNIGLNIYF